MIHYVPGSGNLKFLDLPLRENCEFPYLYSIKIVPNQISRLNCTYPKDFIFEVPDDILHDIKSNVCRLVFDYTSECYDCTHSNKDDLTNLFITNTVAHYNLEKHQVILLTGNLKAYKDLPYTVCILNMWTARIPQASADVVNSQRNLITSRIPKEYKILCLMRMPRYHRLKFAHDIFANNLLNDNIITCHLDGISDLRLNNMLSRFTNQTFVNSLPWKYDVEKYSDMFLSTSNEEQLYAKSSVNFVVETLFDHTSSVNHAHELDISEKVFKPISRMQPFIVMGHEGTLAYLHSEGYKTFDRWWDESYDTELDSSQRYNKIWRLFEYVNSLSKEQLADMLFDMLPVLEHNRQLYEFKLNSKSYLQEFNSVVSKLFDK